MISLSAGSTIALVSSGSRSSSTPSSLDILALVESLAGEGLTQPAWRNRCESGGREWRRIRPKSRRQAHWKHDTADIDGQVVGRISRRTCELLDYRCRISNSAYSSNERLTHQARPWLFEIGAVETLGKPIVDCRQHAVTFVWMALLQQHSGKPRAHAQLPKFGEIYHDLHGWNTTR